MMTKKKNNLRIGLVVPHIFMHKDILPNVIFSPGLLALSLCAELQNMGAKVTLYCPAKADTTIQQVNADMSLFENELETRGDTYISLLKKHPLTFISMARQVQSEIIAKVYSDANNDELDIVHIYGNEEETALSFEKLCNKPVVFTHHDPFNFLARYRSIFPKYTHLNWVSMSLAQRSGMPTSTNWVANVYHGLPSRMYVPKLENQSLYVLYMGRIIEAKGLHLAIKAVELYNHTHNKNLVLKVAGKHYSGNKDMYWSKYILPELDKEHVDYVGYVKDHDTKQELLQNALALIIPSVFEEPFGMVIIEALACATPVIGFNSGAIPEIITDGATGSVVQKAYIHGTKKLYEDKTAANLSEALATIHEIDRKQCRIAFEEDYTLERMAKEHLNLYESLQNH